MPELPEVETIRRDLQRAILGKEIVHVQAPTKRIIKNDLITFLAHTVGRSFTRIDRRGKLLYASISDSNHVLLLHLKMTGQLICQVEAGLIVGGHPMAKIDNLPNQYTHLIFEFEDGSKLYFNDVRTFGYAKIVGPDELASILDDYGIEPLTEPFTLKNFLAVFDGRRTSVKQVLLNQKLIAGIGNIYADEICFRAKIRPDRSVASLSRDEMKRLFNACQYVIGQAVEKRGTTFSNYVDAAGKKGGYMPYLKVYERENRLCLRCEETNSSKIVLGGRGTHFCANCQN